MKKIFGILALTTGMMLISACRSNESGTNTPSEPSGKEDEDEENPGDVSDEKELTIQYFIDFNHADQENPFYEVEWYSGTTIPEPESIPTCPDPAFSKWLGWSAHSLIDDKKDLWNFKTDKSEYGTYYLAIYGIWVAE